jgi:hypothetical protein
MAHGKISFYAWSAALIFLLASCSAKGGRYEQEEDIAYSPSASPAAAMAASQVMSEEAPSGTDGEDAGGEGQYADPALSQRKLVRRANLRIRVEDLSAADTSIEALMKQFSAYASSTNISENSRNYVIRVPAVSYGAFLAELNGMGRLVHRSESAEDVTLRYFDLQGRLATKQELLKTFQSYLGKAKDIEEILSVEVRIAELQDEIDGTGKELRYLGNLVDYATIELDIAGPATTSYSEPTLADRIVELFSGFGEFVAAVLVALTGIVIYGIPCILILALLFWLLFGKVGLIKKLWRIAAGKRIEK